MKVNIRHTKTSDYSEISDLNCNKDDLISKIKGCYEGCLVADLEGIIGYIISFPYLTGKPFPINTFYEPIEDANCWYIHDLCISKEFRGKGIAKELANTVISRNSNVFCLTATEDSENFWSKIGFRTFFDLNYHGEKASYMILIK